MTAVAHHQWPSSLPPAECSVVGVVENGLAVYLVAGQLVASTAAAARMALGRAAKDSKVVLDLSDLNFLDDVGMGVLAGAVRRVHEAGGGVVICAPSGPAASALRASGVGRLVPVVADLIEARAALFPTARAPRRAPAVGGGARPL